MTETELKIDNPYWEAVKDFPEPDFPWGAGRQLARWNEINKALTDGTKIPEMLDEMRRRDYYVTRYSWSVPDPEALAFIVEKLAGRDVVEVGAGTGYWAYLLNQYGVNVNAYDIAPIGTGNNHWHGPKDIEREWHPVVEGDVDALLLQENLDRSLFLSWPPFDKPVASDALKTYKGDQVIYLGEWKGCTGDNDFHTILEAEWNLVGNHTLVQWEGLHDEIFVFERPS